MEKMTNFCLIGKDIETGREVSIGDEERCNHWHIQGITGSGKTTLAIHTFLQDIQHGHGGLFITPDPDGIREIVARLPEERIKDVVLIDPSDSDFPYGSNLLVCPVKQRETEVKDARDRMMHVFKKLWGPGSKDASWGPQLENVLNNCLYLLILNDLTLAELPFVLRDKEIRNYLVARIPGSLPGTPDAFRWTRWFFEKDFGTWGQKLQLERTDSTLNKVLQFLTNPVIENIIGQKTTTLNMRRWMEKKKIILVNLPENTLGEDTVKLLGTMIMAQFKEAVFARERLDKAKRVFFPATCDEFELFAGDDFQTLLVRGRKHNVAFILAHQDMAQITDESLREAVNQTGNKTTFMVTASDAKHFAPIYTPSPKTEQIEEISREEIIGMRPVRTYKQDVISHLLHQGHEDGRVTEFVRVYLQELHIARLKRIEHEREAQTEGQGRYMRTIYVPKTVYPVNQLGIEYDPESLPRVFQELNIWLFEGMRERENLWQPLPDFTHSFLARFFGFKEFYTICHIPVQSYVEASWRKIAAGDFPAEEAGDSGYGRAELFNATIAAIETAFVDFLTSLFPAIPYASVRETIGQSGITTLTSAQLQEQATAGLTRISFTLLPTAYRENFDMARYIRGYLRELSVPQNAIAVFLPVLFTSYRGSVYASDWRSVREVKTTETTGPENLTSMEKYGLKLIPSYDYHLEMLIDKLHLGCIQDLQNILLPFLTHLKFFSCLHCAQLALAQQPIWTMDSGQYEPEKRTMTHFLMRSRQTPSEVVGLMEQELVSLEPLSAWCRIQQPISAAGSRIAKQKVTIPLLGPGLTGAALDKRIERIRRQSRVLIAPRTAYAVAEEIRGRVQLLRQTMEEEQPEQQASAQEKALSNQATPTKPQQSTRQPEDETEKVTRRPPRIPLNDVTSKPLPVPLPDFTSLIPGTDTGTGEPIQDSQDELAAYLSRQDVPPARERQPERYQPAAGYSRLGKDIQTGKYVDVPQASRRQGLYILGIQGTGKTGLIENLIIQDIKQGIGVGLLDPHGDLTHAVLSRLPSHREKDVIYLDLADYHYPFGINLFTCTNPSDPGVVSEAASKVMHVFKKLWGKGGIVVEDAWGVTLEELLWNVTLTFLEASKDTAYTMAEIPLFLTDSAFRNRVVNHLTNRHVKDYWLRKYNLLSEKDQREETRSTLNRINAFLTQPIVECIVGQARTTINFRSVMDERKILLVKLSKRHEAVTALIGSMVIAEFLNAAYSRADLPVHKRKQFHIYADEFQNFASEDFTTLLEEARKYGVGITIAHQNRGQLETNLKDRSQSVANLVVFKINSKDADELAGEFAIPPQEAWEEELRPERREVLEKERRAITDPQRTYADIHKQVASELVNLDDHMARVRVNNADGKRVEHTIRTLKPEEGLQDKLLQERIARIQERNIQDGYVRDPAEVEEEIRQRQEQCLHLPHRPGKQETPQPPEDEPPVTRRQRT